ncbi:Hypothetical predicted protein, partial [Drosophila guanche]
MVVSTLSITLENNGNNVVDVPHAAGVPVVENTPQKFSVLCGSNSQHINNNSNNNNYNNFTNNTNKSQQSQQQQEKENAKLNNNSSQYFDMNGNGTEMEIEMGVGVGVGVLVGVELDAIQGSPSPSIASTSMATPQRSASALRRGNQIQRSSTRLRQQQ